jgi:type IV pilus biogenesis protein PilP
LQDKLKLTQKEIEYLKATLEEKKLRKEIKEIERSLAEGERAGMVGSEPETPSRQVEKGQAKSQDRLLVKAILVSDSRKAALLVCGNRKAWVHEGEQFDGWQIKEIREESVVVWRRGKTFVFFYDRPAIFKEGES